MRAVQPGDVIFIGGEALWFQAGQSLDPRTANYGHVGIAMLVHGRLLVAEATGSPTTAGSVGHSTPAAFLAHAERALILRPADPDGLQAAISEILESRPTFDQQFSLDTARAIYCTELVWRGLSAVHGAEAPRPVQVMGRPAVTPRTLMESPLLRVVSRFGS